jgi:hypothetical protein
MTLVSTSPAELPHRDHRWRARRDAALLADGIALEIQPHADSAGATCVRFTLTNLAGHDYPTGTARRAIRLYAGPAGADDLPLLAAMSPRRPGWLWTDTQPPLAPGEQRHYDLMLPDSAQSVDYRLVFFRNTLDPNGFTNVITVGTVAVTPSASAEQAAAP